MRFIDLLASCYLIVHSILLCFMFLDLACCNTFQSFTKSLLLIVLVSSGFLFKTVRQIFIKELFKVYYVRHFLSLMLYELPCHCIIYRAYTLALYIFIIVLDVELFNFNASNTILMLIFILMFICEIIIFERMIYNRVLKKYFELNTNKYTILYWHCKQIFKKPAASKTAHIPKTRCVWESLNAKKIPWTYFGSVYYEFIVHTLSSIGAGYILYCIDGDKYTNGHKHMVIKAAHYVGDIIKNIYNIISDYKIILGIPIFILIIALSALYLKKVLEIIISNVDGTFINDDKDNKNKSFVKRPSRLYFKTKPKCNKVITCRYALKWSFFMVSGILLFIIIDSFIADKDIIIFVKIFYLIMYLTILYFALNYHVVKYSDMYIKVFTYNKKRYEFFQCTDNWAL